MPVPAAAQANAPAPCKKSRRVTFELPTIQTAELLQGRDGKPVVTLPFLAERGREKPPMGNSNSGRRGGRLTSEATQSLVLEMASLTCAGLEAGLLARTTLHYGEEHFPVELTIDTASEDAGFIDFAHDTRTRSPERISYRTEAAQAADEAFAKWIGRQFGISEKTKA